MHQYNLPLTDLSNWIENEEQRKIEEQIRSYTEKWAEFEYRGYPIGKWCETSVAWQLTGETIDESLPRVQWLYQRTAYAACITAAAFEHGLSIVDPDVLVLFNGIFAPERVAFEVARRRGIRVVTHECGHHKDSFILAHNEPANYFQYDTEWEVRRERPLTDDERKSIRGYLQRRAGTEPDGGRINYWSSMTENRKKILKELDLDPDRPTLVLFPNIVWDSAVLKRDVAFEGLLDWVFYTIELMKELPEHQLIIRSHPAEIHLNRSTDERIGKKVRQHFCSVPSNVRIVPPESDISSYRLMDMSDAVLAYTSTTGMEAALRGKPVLVAGETHYRGKGFTIDIETKEEYRRLLGSDLSSQAPTEEEVNRAERYAHLFFLEAHVSFPFFTNPGPGSPIKFEVDSFDELKQGKCRALDQVCKSVVNGRSFVYPGECSKEQVLKDISVGVFSQNS
ncbi:hypothetical protein [Salinibacter altiplanensis]|uniref:capsular polysaccharide export protein, LipB/KpsS family n=1 Tax=Salinibacter altiplanensis TaxID=1803181 RepID=UPI001319E22C|nr:hypothetical protein [Salinibacter altiplanensis]